MLRKIGALITGKLIRLETRVFRIHDWNRVMYDNRPRPGGLKFDDGLQAK